MKKALSVLFCLLISNACFANTNHGTISNKRIFIQQALDGGALGYICPKWSLGDDDCYAGQFVYFNFNYDFVDKQRFKIPRNYTLYADGVYKYVNIEGHSKTVRKVDIYLKD